MKKKRRRQLKGSAVIRTTIYFRGISKHLKDHWKANCTRRGKTMSQRLEELMRKDIRESVRLRADINPSSKTGFVNPPLLQR